MSGDQRTSITQNSYVEVSSFVSWSCPYILMLSNAFFLRATVFEDWEHFVHALHVDTREETLEKSWKTLVVGCDPNKDYTCGVTNFIYIHRNIIWIQSSYISHDTQYYIISVLFFNFYEIIYHKKYTNY